MSEPRPSASKTLASEGDTLSESAADWGREVLPAGSKVGRYGIVRLLGMGGMGAVYEAFDARLDRSIALKLVRLGSDPDAARRRRGRLRREAQAMAQLSHPNVVTINDIGSHGDQTYIAMELIDGRSAADWLAERPPWREVLRVFVAAGRGLAAAHHAGLVHRDFKPHNIMLARDGRVLVTDFGLVRAATTTESRVASSDDDSELARAPIDTGTLTRDGAFLGTPAYTAPEAYAAGSATERSDQFSFCVSLFEGLYGARPYTGDTIGELLGATSSGQLNLPEHRERIPAHVRRAVLRGLRPDPAERHPSMDDLLRALEPPRSRLPIRIAVVGVAAVLGVVGLLALDDDGAGCGGGEAVWDESQAAQLRAALQTADPAGAEATWPRIEWTLAGYASALQSARAAACRAPERNGRSTDLQNLCLQRTEAELIGVIDVLRTSEDIDHKRALSVVGELPDISQCATPDASVSLPAGSLDEFKAVNVDLARLHARVLLGATEGRVEEAQAVVERARRLDHATTLAAALWLLGKYQASRLDLSAADASLSEAIELATTAGADRILAEAWVSRVRVLAVARDPRALELIPAAEAAMERVNAGPHQRIIFEEAVALAAEQNGRHELALKHYSESIALARAQGIPPNLPSLHGLGSALTSLGRCPEALEAFREHLQIVEREYGADHPLSAYPVEGIGTCHMMAGDFPAAEDALRRVVDLRSRQYGPNSFHVLYSKASLGTLLTRLGRYEEAMSELKPFVDPQLHMPEGMEGEQASALVGIATSQLGLGETEHARESAARALVLAEMSADLGVRQIAHATMGAALAASDEHDAAVEEFIKALEGPRPPFDSPGAYHARCVAAADAARQAGRAGDGAKMLEHCISLVDGSGDGEAEGVDELRELRESLARER